MNFGTFGFVKINLFKKCKQVHVQPETELLLSITFHLVFKISK